MHKTQRYMNKMAVSMMMRRVSRFNDFIPSQERM